MESKKRKIFFEKGLRFQCCHCSACCMGEPGFVWVTAKEIQLLAAYLDIPLERFCRDYLRTVEGEISLREMEDGRCMLLGEKGCRVYPVRPSQCRTFPFWEENLETEEDWKEVERSCPGVGRGKEYSLKEIRAILDGRGETEPVSPE